MTSPNANIPSPTQYGRIFPADAAWLAMSPSEPVLEADLPIVDSHHHFFKRPGHRYFFDEFLADVSTGHNIVATVSVQCDTMHRADGPEEMRPVGETEFVVGQAAMSASGEYGPTRMAAGIVAYADLALGDHVEPVLEALIQAGGGRLRGVRHCASFHADPLIGNGCAYPHLLRQPEFRAGLARLTALGLTFDLWVYHPQHDEAVDVVRATPETLFILGHCGGPLGIGPYAGKRDAVFATWKASMTELSRCPNVVCKLGGLMMRLAVYDYGALAAPPSSAELAAYWRPWIETCIELFGADRCMFESNFPIDKMGIGYASLWNAFKRITEHASAEEKRALYADTAQRVYQL